MPPSHQAQYDSEGNIILPSPPEVQRYEEPLELAPPPTHPVSQRERPTVDALWRQVRGRIGGVASDFLTEGAQQYRMSLRDGTTLWVKMKTGSKSLSRILWSFLAQPVWIPARNHTVKQYSRGTLFLIDTVRFGGTFAGIFLLLFVSLNYESFWKIFSANLNPLRDLPGAEEEASGFDSALKEKLKHVPSLSTAGRAEGNLLSYLPEVGPPENLLIIAKLNLNVPLVTPPFEALLQEDWAQVETDIQSSLQYGVVHYPGTARPGQAGNFFVTGHSSYYPWADGNYKTVFARLQELHVGDEYWVYYGGDKHRYVIREKKEVRPSDISVLDQPSDARLSTLMTCTPVGTTLRRLIIVAEEVDPITGIALEVGAQSERDTPNVPLELLPI